MSYINYDDVVEQLRSAGLVLDLPLRLANGKKSVRCLADGEGKEKRGWYRLHEWFLDNGDAMLVGSYGVYRGDDPGTVKVELTKRCTECGREMSLMEKACPACGSKEIKKRELTQEQKDALKEKLAQDKKRADDERSAEIDQAAQWAAEVWRHCREVEPGGHDYLVRKKLTGTGGVRVFESNDGLNLVGSEADDLKYLTSFHGSLVVPMTDASGKVFGLQFILDRQKHKARIEHTGRDKDYWPAGLSKEAHYWLIGGTPSGVALEAEGFATAQSLHDATGMPVAVAFDAGNLPKVAKALKSAYRRSKILVCADDDHLQKCRDCGGWTKVDTEYCTHCGKPHGKTNAGKQRAQEAALLVDGAWVAPQFAAERPLDRKGPTDFNDLRVDEGLAVVRTQIETKLRDMNIATTPQPAESSREAGAAEQGGGERKSAQAVMPVDDLVERFIPLDDGTGEYVFDTWTNKLAKKAQMLALLPAGGRGDDIKRHPLWIHRGAYYLDQVGFDPSGKDALVKLNTWQGWPMKPKRGGCDLIRELLYYLCSDDPNGVAVAEWIFDWMAYPLQHPGAKMNSAIVMHGPQGTGKSTIFQALAKIYGDYATVLNQRGLEDRFNSDWSDSKLFILAEEVVTRAEMWHIKNELKELVTGEWIRINPKNIAAYRQRNQINVVFLSNENQPIPIENDDRRHLVVYTPIALSETFYDEVFLEIENGGVEAFYDFLLSRDLSKFHPKKRPPMTEAKQRLIALSAPSEIRFAQEWIMGELGLPICPCLAADLYAVYLKWCRTNGESRPRPSNQFHGALAHQPGWNKSKQRVYPNASARETVPKPIVSPPPAVLSAAGTAQPPDVSQARWLTDSVNRFSEAVKGEEERWAA